MPTYEYRCKECGERLEVVQSFTDDALTECPACGGVLRKVFGNVGITFKGSGFYRTDSRKASTSKSSKSSESSESSSASESKSDAKSDGASSDGAKKDSKPDKSDSSAKKTTEKVVAGGVTTADVGVFGGSGFTSFLEVVDEVAVETPYGAPSAPVTVHDVGGRRVAFLPRHGRAHERAPHRINYRANLWALHSLGCRSVLAPFAAGSLSPTVHPGDLVVVDQFVDRTWGRADTFHDDFAVAGPQHVSPADPYDETLRAALVAGAQRLDLAVHATGTVVVIQGPRFATRAESQWYRAQGWSVINMTQYPEAVLARELDLAYAGIALVTDYDTGVEGGIDAEGNAMAPVTQEQVFAFFEANLGRLRDLLVDVIPRLP